MSTTAAADTGLEPASAPSGEPQWLPLEPEPLYVVLHTPERQTHTARAALLLPAFGWDDECSYRRRREWAIQLACAGITTVRFDFPGRENSAGSPLKPGRAESWVSAAVEAARWLRERSGCERLTAIGIGLGGMIAYQAVVADDAIDDLVLWGARASGRAYVRELRAYAAVTSHEDATDAARDDGAIGIGGHIMSADTATALSAVDLTTQELPDAGRRRVLLIGRDTHGVDARLRDHLVTQGAELTVLESDEYRSLMSPADIGISPVKTMAASIEWILAGVPATPAADASMPGSGAGTAVDTVSFDHDGVPIRERVVTIDSSAGRLRGVISEPAAGTRVSCCLVTVNSGALRHTGPNRMFVEIGRRAAANGVPSARIDLPGLGDSDGTAIKSFERTDADDRRSLAVLRDIYDHLEHEGVAGRFVAAGFSLGGYLTVRAATSDRRVIGALSVNPTGFVWTDKQRKRVLKDLIALAGPQALAAEIAPPGPPGRLHRLTARIGQLRRLLDARLRQRLARSDFLWRVEHRREIAGLNDRLDELARAGTRMLLLLSEDEQLLRMLARPRASAKLARCRHIRVERLPNQDHLLRPLWIQEIVAERFVSWLVEFSSAGDSATTETPDDLPG